MTDVQKHKQSSVLRYSKTTCWKCIISINRWNHVDSECCECSERIVAMWSTHIERVSVRIEGYMNMYYQYTHESRWDDNGCVFTFWRQRLRWYTHMMTVGEAIVKERWSKKKTIYEGETQHRSETIDWRQQRTQNIYVSDEKHTHERRLCTDCAQGISNQHTKIAPQFERKIIEWKLKWNESIFFKWN